MSSLWPCAAVASRSSTTSGSQPGLADRSALTRARTRSVAGRAAMVVVVLGGAVVGGAVVGTAVVGTAVVVVGGSVVGCRPVVVGFGTVVAGAVPTDEATPTVLDGCPAAVTSSPFPRSTRPSAASGARHTSAITISRRTNEGDLSPPSWRSGTPRPYRAACFPLLSPSATGRSGPGGSLHCGRSLRAEVRGAVPPRRTGTAGVPCGRPSPGRPR